MNVVQEKVNNLTSLLKITVAKEDYSPKVEKAVKDLSKKVQIKGFRKGFVPSGVIKNMYGAHILADELNKMVQDEVNKYLTDNKISLLGYPLPQNQDQLDLDIKKNENYEFVFEMGLKPEFDIKLLSSKTEFNKNIVKIDDALINKEIESLQKAYGKVTHPEKIGAEDILRVKMTELDGNTIKQDGLVNTTSFPVDMVNTKFQEEILALKKDGKKNFNVYKLFDKDKEEIAKQILGIEEDEISKYGNNFEMLVEEITHVEKCPVDEELFKKIYQDGSVKTLEEFKAKYTEDLKAHYKAKSEELLDAEILKKLIDNVKVPLPDDFLAKWIKHTKKRETHKHEDGHDHDHEHHDHEYELTEKEYESFAKSIRWMLISKKALKDNNISVTSEEVKEKLKESVLKQFGITKPQNEEEEKYINEFTERFMQNEDYFNNVFDKLQDEKLFNFLKSTFTIKDKEVTFEEFKEINKNLHKKPKSKLSLSNLFKF